MTELLDTQTLIQRLYYQGRQYAAGRASRGGSSGPHMLEQAAAKIEDQLASIKRKDQEIAQLGSTVTDATAKILKLRNSYTERVKEWRDFGEGMHQRAMKAEAEAKELREGLKALGEKRADGMPTSGTERKLRRMLASYAGIPHMYRDDGEAQGQQHGINIDFMRDSVESIERKLFDLGVIRLTAQMNSLEQDIAKAAAAKPVAADVADIVAGALQISRADAYEKMREALYELVVAVEYANTICRQAYDANGKRVVTGVRSSVDPHRDCRIMETAIEFFYAAQRGADITPNELWKHVMGIEYVPKTALKSGPSFERRTTADYAEWCKSFYTHEFASGPLNLHGLWAWQEQQRRIDAAQENAT